jgi:CheY-like chemotaxis protein
MGGDIAVESEAGAGSRFVFELLVPLAHAETMVPPRRRTVVGYRGPRRKVLVVDDVPENRALIADYLRPLEFEVVEAADGRAGIEQARREKPDLILMDNVMPVMNGLEATRRLREEPEVGHVAIIAISASASQNDRDRSFAAGVDAFLHKPIDFNELLRHVAALLQITWTYDREDDEETVATGPLVTPPPEQMRTLHHLAMMGNMREIRQHAANLAALDARYRPFADTLDGLARLFQASAIRRFVEQHLEHGGS